jgi:thiosulfate/3-mercaptopyruvate sulfurtransferase
MRSMPTTLIAASELATHLNDADWVIIDCRFDLARPDWGAQAYAAGHIPHALYAHLDHDLSAARTPRSGRHPLPQVEALAITLGRFGIDERVQVIAYDQGPGAYAARLWWLLRWLGHPQVAVLDGGLAAWERAGLPLSSAIEPRAPRRFRASADARQVVGDSEVAQLASSGALRTQAQLLIDARSADRFAGENESIDPVAGHVPGARNHPFATNLGSDGRFAPLPELRQRLSQSQDGVADDHTIVMCGSGVTACNLLLAMEAAGKRGARLYAGSWSEWIREPSRPIKKGTD